MREFLAIVGDTWRQSRQQVVFIVMCVLLALTTIVFVGYPKMHTSESGETEFGFLWVDEPVDWLAEGWIESAVEARMLKRGDSSIVFSDDSDDDFDERFERRKQVQEEFEVEAREIGKLQRSVEMWLYLAAQVVFSISMLLFIGASAAYFPDLLAAGAVDVVLAKPLSRLQVFLGKYFGGLVLYSAAVTVTYLLIAVGIGLRTGIWSTGLFAVIPMQIFAAAVLYAIVSCVGVFTRSTSMAVVIGYVFYLVIDTAIETAGTLQLIGVAKEFPMIDKLLSLTHYMPSIGFLKTVATNQVLYAQPFEMRPVIVAAVWLLVTLALAYRRFRRTDF